jgi:pimeloyl-ACP methyl ester carboxylesterase
MKMRMLMVTFAVLITLLVPLSAQPLATAAPLPADLQGELDGVPYHIRVPENWNGMLLVYAHGYGENAIPPVLAPQSADVQTLLGKGFALAASSFAGSGWTVKEGMQNTVALTAAFNGMVGRPHRTIIWGKSMGGLMTLGLIEKFPGHYDGAVALCPPASGTPRRFDQGLDIALAYAVAFGDWKPEWGTPGDIRDDLNFMTEVVPYVHLPNNPYAKARWEFIRLVSRAPDISYYADMNWLMTLYFAVGVRAELEHRAGGAIAENIGREYTLTDGEKTHLEALGLDVEELLGKMNAMTLYTSERNARMYAEHYVNPSGQINRPVLTLHTTGDSLATTNNESAYRAIVEQQGNEDLLMQQFTSGAYDTNGKFKNAHCSFSSAQAVAGIDAMMYWLDTGNRPDPADFFTSALGFVPDFNPEPWPW